MSAITGWPWHVLDDMTFPRLRALRAAWGRVPPVAVTLQRLARHVGLPDPDPAQRQPKSADEALQYFAQAGLPVMATGRPDDPDLDLVGL